MSPRGKTYLRYAVSILLTVGFLYWAFRGTDFTNLYESTKGIHYWWIFVSFMFLVASHVFRAWRWRYLLEPIKPNIGMRNLISGVMVGFMWNNLLPRGGELVRPYTIGKLEGIPKSSAFGTIVVERIIDMISFLVLLAIVPLVYDGPLRQAFPWLDSAEIWVSAITFIFIVIVVSLVVRRDWADKMIAIAMKMLPKKISDRLERMTHNFLDGFLFIKSPQRLALIFFQSIIVWGLFICMMYAAFFAYDLGLDFKAAVVIQAISAIGFIIPTAGGTGSYHVFTTQSLTELFGVSKTTALSYATVTHAVTFIGIVIIGLYFFYKDHIRVSDAVVDDMGSQESGKTL